MLWKSLEMSYDSDLKNKISQFWIQIKQKTIEKKILGN